MSEFDGIHIMYEKSLYTTFLALALTMYSCTTLFLSLPFFPHFEIFPVNTKLYAVCVLLQNIKFLYSNSLGLVLSHSEYSYSSSFCLESFSLVLSPALALARLTFDKENVICGSVVVMAELCAILCFIKLFHSPQDIEHNLTTEYKKSAHS